MARAAARARRRRSRANPEPGWGARILSETSGLVVVGLSLLTLLALLTWDPTDPVFQRGPVENAAGVVGATVAALLRGGLGLGAIVVTGTALLVGGRLVMDRGIPAWHQRFWVGSLFLLVALSALPPLLHGIAPARFPDGLGGSFGEFLASHGRGWLGAWGSLLLGTFTLLLGALHLLGISTGAALNAVAAAGAAALIAARELLEMAGNALSRSARELLARGSRVLAMLTVWRERRARRGRVAAARGPELPDEVVDESGIVTPTPGRRRRGEDPYIVDHHAEQDAKAPRQATFAFNESRARGSYKLPGIELFDRPRTDTRNYDRESLIMNSRILEKKLKDFGVTGRVVTVHPGPVITMYEFEPASGVKVNRIVNLSDDLALALRALSVRIVAPLPGKSVVGIEVPNAEREMVYYSELLESDAFTANSSKLSFALGKDIFGNSVTTDLARMPHLLVAGATGTGKSVFLNSLLCSLLCRATADELKLLLIDPKLLELSIYENIPHLIADVVTQPKRASAALMGIVHKMEERYRWMLALGVRNLDQFNARVDEELAAGNETFQLKALPGEEPQEVHYVRLPYIVVVIDELADLMVVCGRDVEESLQRLAQMARAAGIHLVLATQRPSVDVLTGIIKANFPARISFQVSSRTDSRTILDQNGAEHLLGQGDMLFLPPGTSKVQRVHGAFVSEGEVLALVNFLRAQGNPVFDETLLRAREEADEKSARGPDVDDLYDRAVALVAETRNASISYVQRRLKIGYNRAARIVEQMEEEGVVGPQIGTKSRDVFVQPLVE